MSERPRICFRLHLRYRAAIRRASAIIGERMRYPALAKRGWWLDSRSRSRSPTKSGLTIPGVTTCKDCMKLFVVNAMLARDTVHTGLEKCTVPTGTLFAPSNAAMGGAFEIHFVVCIRRTAAAAAVNARPKIKKTP